MVELLKTIGIGGLAVLVCFYLVRDVLGPLVKRAVKKGNGNGDEKQEKQDKFPESAQARVLALELNWSAVSAQVVSLESLLNRTVQSVDHKIDTLLERLTEIRDGQAEHNRLMSERMAKAETNIDNLKERMERPRGGK